jgi:hypothetical protein
VKVNSLSDAISATKYIEDKIFTILSKEMADTVISLRKFLCQFGDMLGVQSQEKPQEKTIETLPKVESDVHEYKFSWTQYLKKDLKCNGASTIKEIFERFLVTQKDTIAKLGEERCNNQIRAGAFHLKKLLYLTKEGEGRKVKWTPTEKLLREE